MYRALLLNEKRFLQRNKTHVVAKKHGLGRVEMTEKNPMLNHLMHSYLCLITNGVYCLNNRHLNINTESVH